jgi:hypothetical protein
MVIVGENSVGYTLVSDKGGRKEGEEEEEEGYDEEEEEGDGKFATSGTQTPYVRE